MTAYARGQVARRVGLSALANPFVKDPRRRQWAKGWASVEAGSPGPVVAPPLGTKRAGGMVSCETGGRMTVNPDMPRAANLEPLRAGSQEAG